MRRARPLVLALCLLACGATGTARAQTGAPFLQSVSAGTLPTGTNPAEWGLASTACATSYCVSVGYAYDAANHGHALVITSSNGVAGPAQWASLPNGANASAPDAQLYGVSCWSTSSCVAIGFYTDSSGSAQGLIVPIIDGVVQPGVTAPLPTDASSTPNAYLYGVSCATGGVCEAVGYYGQTSGGYPAIVIPIVDGVPGAAAVVALPGNSISPQDASLQGVSCWSAGNCEAVGSYSVGGGAQPMTVAIAGGTPSAAVSVARPAGSASAVLYHVSCWAAGSCAAVGNYENSLSQALPLAALVSGGSPGPGVAMPLPAAVDPAVAVELNQLACSAGGSCVAVGQYYSDPSDSYAFDVPIQSGTIGSGQDVSLPSDASTGSQLATLADISCPPAGACLAVGSYKDSAGKAKSMEVTLAGGVLSAAATAQAPADESVGAPYAALAGVGCGSTGSCAAFGEYNNVAGAPFVLSAQAPLSVSATSLPAGAIGSAYSQALVATGAWGVYGWSVTSGTLPAGLTLNASTGVISGTPTASGTSTFTVQATGTGVPVQSATQSLSITVAAVRLSVAGGVETIHRNRFGLKLGCDGGACSGVVKLQARETYSVRRGKRHLRRHRIVVLASLSFSLTAGQTRSYTVGLSGAGRRALALDHRLAVTALGTLDGVKQAFGQLTLRAAPVKHRRKRR